MPLNSINGYNDAFKAFTDFATQAKGGSTIAQISDEKNAVGGTGPLAGRTIVAKTGFDFIGNVGRRQASRDVNNAVRDLFKQAIADMFGGPDKIPESVRDAMKMADFGKGKPLTARRILAVKTAVDQVARWTRWPPRQATASRRARPISNTPRKARRRATRGSIRLSPPATATPTPWTS